MTMRTFYALIICVGLVSALVYAQVPVEKKHTNKRTALPGVVIDHQERYVDIQAKVVLRDGDWLEQLLCTPGTREHESILTTAARPSHIHLGLIMLGLSPGKPMVGEKIGEELKITPASGPKVAIDLIYTQDGELRTVPANTWIYDKNTDKPMEDNIWLFAGSSFIQAHDQNIYRADANGSVITLVHFGDDLLARQTMLTSHNDNARWQAMTRLIPPVGTMVTIRLTPVKDQNTDQSEQPKPQAP